MSENNYRLEEIEQQLIQFKKIPAFSFAVKGQAAEAIIEKTVYLMRCIVADIEDLKRGGK